MKYAKMLTNYPAMGSITADMSSAKDRRDVEAFLEFVNGRVASLSPQDRQELIEQAHKDVPCIRANRNFGTAREGSNR